MLAVPYSHSLEMSAHSKIEFDWKKVNLSAVSSWSPAWYCWVIDQVYFIKVHDTLTSHSLESAAPSSFGSNSSLNVFPSHMLYTFPYAPT